ncbi:MAG: hypothetical protein LUQ22_09160, partial [Methanotrichaceae archaeon]|nr:hypothetical protein [Methanotrichaceae archaeon]
AKNVGWFKSINDGMRKLIKAQESGDKSQRNRIIDEIIIMEGDPIVKKRLENLKKLEITIDIITMIHETLNQLGRIFPILDLSRIDEIEIGIEPHKKS